MDGAGNLYIADAWNYRIRGVDSVGNITTIAGIGSSRSSPSIGDGGPALEAWLFPKGVSVDRAGNLYIADTSNNRIRFMSNGCDDANSGEASPLRRDPLKQATYSAKQVIRVMVTFSEPMVVAGRPQLAIEVGGVDRAAVYGKRHGGPRCFLPTRSTKGNNDTDGREHRGKRPDARRGGGSETLPTMTRSWIMPAWRPMWGTRWKGSGRC